MPINLDMKERGGIHPKAHFGPNRVITTQHAPVDTHNLFQYSSLFNVTTRNTPV